MVIRNLVVLLGLMMISNLTFALTTLDGKADKIENYLGKGKWTVVEVWESNCSACRMHMPDMVMFDGKLENVQLLGISLDTQNGVKKTQSFIDEYDIEFPTLVSNNVETNIWLQQTVGQGLLGTPTFVIFNPEGKRMAVQSGIVATASLERYITSRSKTKKTDKQVSASKTTTEK